MKKPHIWLFVGILAMGAFFRFFLITEIPPGLYPDEAMNGNNALEALATGDFKIFYPENNGREGLFINMQALSLALFGNTPWALRIVSALFGTLTIIGVYLVAKELLASNAAALLASFFLATSYWHINFSRTGFRAIMVPFLAAFGVYFLLKGLRRGSTLDLALAGVFTGLGLHTYIAFRFMAPVFAVPLVWYLWQWRKKSEPRPRPKGRGIWAGFVGKESLQRTQSIISPPSSPPQGAGMKEANSDKKSGVREEEKNTPSSKFQVPSSSSCAPCAVALFAFVVFVAALPLGLYFMEDPYAFTNRAGEISVFAAASPLKEFTKSAGLTARMLFWRGDCNWRHNFNCQPQLNPLIALFFVIGIISLVASLKSQARSTKSEKNSNVQNKKFKTFRVLDIRILNLFRISNLGFRIFPLHAGILLVWLAVMALPAILTKEGIPHALRAIGMIPPLMILAGLGADQARMGMTQWIQKQKAAWPQRAGQGQIDRLHYELLLLFAVTLLLVPLMTYRTYFLHWSNHPKTYEAFDAPSYHLGQFLADPPEDVQTYVIVNARGVSVRGIPMPAQTVMFMTDSFTQEKQKEKHIRYIAAQPGTAPDIASVVPTGKNVIAFIDSSDIPLIKKTHTALPHFRIQVPGDFVILQNF